MTVRADQRLGTELAGYRIEALLGRGGMGAVYLAEDVALGRKVALKLLLPELAESERFRERFLRESRLAASLDHPNVIPVYQAGEADGVLFIAMRYVEGTDLKDVLSDTGALEPAHAIAVVEQVAEALDAAHERGLVHRDVKPANVLISERGGRSHCYLADFGLTKHASSISGITASGQVIGTVDYLAPEQVQGEGADARSDLYALACVLFECLTGRPPFARETEVATLWAQVQEEAPAPSTLRSELPRALDAVLAKGLAKDPAARYPGCGELAGAAAEAIGAPRARRLRPPRRRVRRRRMRRLHVLAAVVGAAVAVAVAGAAVLLARGGEGGGLSSVPPNSVGLIDPATNRIAAAVPVGADPTAVTVGGRAVWVANRLDGTVSRIDPGTQTVVRTIPVTDGPTLTGLAAAGDTVWVGKGVRGPLSLSRLDATFNRVATTRTIGSVQLYALGRPWPLAAADGAVWAATPGRLLRLAPRTLETTATRSLAIDPSGLAVGHGAVWISNPRTNLARVDPRTPAPARPYTVAAGANAIAIGEDAVWVVGEEEDVVSRVDPASDSVTTLEVGDHPTAIAAGEGAVWVANRGDGTISRIDPESRRVVATIRVGGAPQGIAVGAGGVWVTVAASQSS